MIEGQIMLAKNRKKVGSWINPSTTGGLGKERKCQWNLNGLLSLKRGSTNLEETSVNTALAAILVAANLDRRRASGSGIRAGMVFGTTRLPALAVVVFAPTQVAVAVAVMAASSAFATAAMAAAASVAKNMACELRG